MSTYSFSLSTYEIIFLKKLIRNQNLKTSRPHCTDIIADHCIVTGFQG